MWDYPNVPPNMGEMVSVDLSDSTDVSTVTVYEVSAGSSTTWSLLLILGDVITRLRATDWPPAPPPLLILRYPTPPKQRTTPTFPASRPTQRRTATAIRNFRR